MPIAEGHSLVEAHGYDVVEPQLATCLARPGPTRSPTGSVRTRPVLTLDRSTLTVDLAPHVSDTVLLDPHVRW
jgi:hypothetical protein